MQRLNYCFHTHTARCGHASGTDEEYIEEAYKVGVRHMGFSDHVMLPGIVQPPIRAQYSFLDDYIFSINNLKKKYKDKLELKLGFECEWYGDRFKNYYKSLLNEKGFEYLILGLHCYLPEGSDIPRWYALDDRDEGLDHYVKDAIEAMATGLFTYMAHPDVFMIWYGEFDKHAEEACKKIAKAAVKYDIPLELNMGSLRRECHNPLTIDEDAAYPKKSCWEVFSKYPVKVVMGYDAHSPKDFSISKKKDVKYLYSLVRDFNLNLIGTKEIFKKKK